MDSSRVSPKLIGLVFIGILLLSVSYVLFMSENISGKLGVKESVLFPDGMGTLSDGKAPLFRQALRIHEGLSLEVSSPDRRLLVRIFYVPDETSGKEPLPDPLALYEALRRNEGEQSIPQLAAQFTGAHLDLVRGKAKEKLYGKVCENDAAFLPLDENKSRHSLFGAVDCKHLRFYVQGVAFDKPVSETQLIEILNLLLPKANWG